MMRMPDEAPELTLTNKQVERLVRALEGTGTLPDEALEHTFGEYWLGVGLDELEHGTREQIWASIGRCVRCGTWSRAEAMGVNRIREPICVPCADQTRSRVWQD